jgi:hypothetical protein
MKQRIFTIIAAVLFMAGTAVTSAEAGNRWKVWTPTVAEYGTAQWKAWNYYCENSVGEKVRAVVDAANAPALKDPNAIYVYQVVRGAHPLSEQFRENRVLFECRKILGYDTHITGVDEVVPDWRR